MWLCGHGKLLGGVLSGIGEVSVPFPLMNRVKKSSLKIFGQISPQCSGMPHRLDWFLDKSREGGYFLTEKRPREGDCELRLQVMRIECTVATLPPKRERTYLRGE